MNVHSAPTANDSNGSSRSAMLSPALLIGVLRHACSTSRRTFSHPRIGR